MIVIAIIGILATVAIPQYSNYTQRAKFAGVISAVIPFKMAVGECILDQNDPAGCDNNVDRIGAAITTPVGNTASISVKDGSITAIGTKAVNNAVYKLDPVHSKVANTLTWRLDSSMADTCLNNSLCKAPN